MRLNEVTGYTIEEILAELDRRGFLRGLGKGIVAAVIPGSILSAFSSSAQAAQNKDKREEFDSYAPKPFKIPSDSNGIYKFCVPPAKSQDGKIVQVISVRYSLKEKDLLYSYRVFDCDSFKSGSTAYFDYAAEDEDVNEFLKKVKSAEPVPNKKLVTFSISHIIGLRACSGI